MVLMNLAGCFPQSDNLGKVIVNFAGASFTKA